MQKWLNTVFAFIVVVVILVASGSLYTVDETQQVVLTQFGKLIGEPKQKAGLYFKIPFIQTANYFDKRILEWDGDPNEIPTRDKRNIFIDTIARWQIVDPLKFMRAVGSEVGAQTLLDDILDAKTREVISGHYLVEAVRNSNRLIQREDLINVDDDDDFGKIALEEIEKGRETLRSEILAKASEIMPTYGIKLVDVRIKRINYVQKVRDKVYERMISERKRAAEQFRSEGNGKRAEIEGQMTKELEEISSEAYRRAQEISGKADAEAVKVYADAFNNDKEFYAFLRTLESYRKSVKPETTLILTTDNDYYEFLKDADVKTQP